MTRQPISLDAADALDLLRAIEENADATNNLLLAVLVVNVVGFVATGFILFLVN